MELITRKFFLPILIATFLFGLGCVGNLKAQQTANHELISPIYGKVMLLGTGDISIRASATFAYLAGEEKGKLVIICNKKKEGEKAAKKWESLIGKVSVVNLDVSNIEIQESDIQLIQGATAVWLTNDFSEFSYKSLLNEALQLLLHRNGVIGGQGPAAESMATLIEDGEKFRDGFNLIPNSIILAGTYNKNAFIETGNKIPGRVAWEIPAHAAVVVHSGRQISVIGDPEITLMTAAHGEWPERVATFGPRINDLPFTADLMSWNRSATARLGELFPPSVAPVPEVPNGALVIIGGHGYPEGLWEKVVDSAGGKDANWVCLSQSDRCWGAEKLWGRGCKNVAVHLVKLGVEGIGQGSDPKLLKDLENAEAVYFGGGRTYKYLDAYFGTPAHELMKKVLERGGIIVGTSAGAQIQGDYLVRGDPRTNNTLYLEGSDQGLGFLNGVIIDAHFRERGRHKITPQLLVKYPQMLGIGIDETTAIWVEGTTAEVMGPHSVTFYDLNNQKNLDPTAKDVGNPVILMEGEIYDLKNRKKVD